MRIFVTTAYSILEKFLAKVSFQESGCWLWTGEILKGGYGRFYFQDEKVLAHRWAYEYFVGPISTGMTLDHLCRIPNCANPDHVEQVTFAENLERGYQARTHCKRGHLYTPETT